MARRLAACFRLAFACGAVLGSVALAAGPGPAEAVAQDPIETARALRCFLEMKSVSERDAGRTWERPLYGPMMFVDPATRFTVANQADAEGWLTARGKVFVGWLPSEVTIANTSTGWAGVRWTMVLWPLPANATSRAILMAHECWHRIQYALGLPAANSACPHLDTLEGRYWLQLEWLALRRALLANGDARKSAIGDALQFRACRRSLFRDAAALESALEMNEGIAEYTGVKAGCGQPGAARRRAAEALRTASARATFVRSFAYATGPAYGLLLDELGTSWRSGLKPDTDLGDLLGRAAGLAPAEDAAARAGARAAAYDPGTLRRSEEDRERTRLETLASYRHLLVEGPVLEIRLGKFSFSFDPNNLVPLDSLGTVYPTMTVSGEWGTLKVTKGALMAADFETVQVSAPAAPAGSTISGDGWTLELAAGWELRAGERPGDYVLTKKQP